MGELRISGLRLEHHLDQIKRQQIGDNAHGLGDEVCILGFEHQGELLHLFHCDQQLYESVRIQVEL